MADIKYSDSRCGNRTVKEALDASPYANAFNSIAVKVLANCRTHEKVEVSWWYEPFVYVQVIDSRQKHPANMRCLFSYDLSNGKIASAESSNKYAFARKGWFAFMDRLTGYKVTKYSENKISETSGGAA